MGVYINLDGENEPTLWYCPVSHHTAETCDCDRPKALTRKCDVGNEQAWGALCAGVLVINGGVV